MLKPAKHYPRRVNRDGTIDSICLSCFRTIASSRIDAVLLLEEVRHCCDIDSIAYRSTPTRHPGIRLNAKSPLFPL